MTNITGEEDPLKGMKKHIDKQYNENFVDTFSRPESKGSGITVAFLMGLILIFVYTTLHFREEVKSRDQTIVRLEADNIRLSKTAHNPFVHARK